ncbi:MAG: dephospho-CoA kinase [Planctomycetes bacterium]|nr:dephospho-CoA kinase [Planctomycetota bacterium]
MDSTTPAPMPQAAERPVVIGLLGGIGSGKSSVARHLAAAGAAWLDADRLAHAALDAPDVVAALRERHGASLTVTGDPPRIDRASLGRLVFGSAPPQREALAHLESLLHPRVRAELLRRLDAHLAQRDVPAVLLDVPLLLETGAFAPRCDLLLFVESESSARAARVAARHGLSAAEFARREALQWPVAEKRKRADVVLSNQGDAAALERAVADWLAAAGGFAGLPRRPRS